MLMVNPLPEQGSTPVPYDVDNSHPTRAAAKHDLS